MPKGKEEKQGSAEKVTKKTEKNPAKKSPAKASKPDEKAAPKKTRKRRIVEAGNAHVQASYNNTIVTITEPGGNVIAWSSAGSSGFKGARKATPYAAQVSAENSAGKAKIYGLERVHVHIKGVGSGREQAVRGLISSGLDILSISDLTPIPHNGCRKKKQRRV